jgi:hypothetical protein
MSQMKHIFFKLNLLNESGTQLYHSSIYSLHFVQYRPSSIYKVYGFLQKEILLVVCATSHALPATPFHQNGTPFLPSPLCVGQI